jgi:hypothetical protein
MLPGKRNKIFDRQFFVEMGRLAGNKGGKISASRRTKSTEARSLIHRKKRCGGRIYDREFFVERGREGGRIGGKIRAKRMTAEQRSASARHAVLVRWSRWREQHATTTRSHKKML